MRILVSGSHGLIGTRLMTGLKAEGQDVIRLIRRSFSERSRNVGWVPAEREIEHAKLAEVTGVIHLAGESIAGGRWTDERRQRIRDSRVQGTRFLAESLARMERPPKVMLCASAMGYYGDHGEAWVDESTGPGKGFLAEVCKEWEAAADPAREAGIRVVHTRIGLVLSTLGGALRKMIPPFELCLGGPIGSGKQYMSWVAVQDVTRAMLFLMGRDDLEGAFNLCAPDPVTNRVFTHAVAHALHRPAILPLPEVALKLLFGKEMAQDLFLSSTRMRPQRLLEAGYTFRFTDLDKCLDNLFTYEQ